MKINYKNEKLIVNILEFLEKKTGVSVILSRCCVCNDLLSAKLGDGVSGLSDTYCPNCAKLARKKLSQRGSSAIWPLIGCLLVGLGLAAEYIYAIIMYME